MGGLRGTVITDKIAEYLRRGELLNLAPCLAVGSPIDEVVMTSWDGTHSIAAEDVRDLLCGRIVTDPDLRGLRLRAARIRGRLDLDNLTTTVKLTLLDCVLDEGITARPLTCRAMAQRQAQLDRGMLTGRERLRARITGVTLGYGYQPWRALLFLLGVKRGGQAGSNRRSSNFQNSECKPAKSRLRP